MFVGWRVGVKVAVGSGVGEGVAVRVGVCVGVMTGSSANRLIGLPASERVDTARTPSGISARPIGTKTNLIRRPKKERGGESWEDTREAYPSDARVSRNTWQAIVVAFLATISLIGLASVALILQPDIRRAPPLWSDEFDAAPRGWNFDPAEGAIAGGRLRLQPSQPDTPALAIHTLPAGDFVLEARAGVSAGSSDNGYGLLVGDQTEQMAFLISGDGYFSVLHGAGEAWIEVLPWRQWPHVRRGDASNTLRLECSGNSCAFYLNDEFTTQVEVRPRREILGLVTWRYTAEKLVVEFEWLRVWAVTSA